MPSFKRCIIFPPILPPEAFEDVAADEDCDTDSAAEATDIEADVAGAVDDDGDTSDAAALVEGPFE